jgi:hypothetical protein
VTVTKGSFAIVDTTSGGVEMDGNLEHASFTNGTNGVQNIGADGSFSEFNGGRLEISSQCSTSQTNSISFYLSQPNERQEYIPAQGPVECSLGEGRAATQSSSSTMTGTTTQDIDSDRDGIPDSSDRCTHNSYHRCFKEGDASTTITTHEQPSSSSSSSSGNQTR